MVRLVILALAATLPAHLAAGEFDASWSVDVLAGHDSNWMLVTDDGPDAAFTQLRLGGEASRSFGPSFHLFGSGAVETRLHTESASPADHGAGDLRLGATWRPAGLGPDRLSLTLSGSHAAYRATFLDRATGEAYETELVPASDPAILVPIPDRLDYDANGLAVRARFRQSQKLTFLLEGGIERRNYVEDYSRETALDPLDHRSATIQPGIAFAIGRSLALGVSWMFSELEYDARSAVDGDGQTVLGTTREDHFSRLRLSLNTRVGEVWTLRGGLMGADRRDTYAGYYDNGSWTTFVSANRVGPRSGIHLYLSHGALSYDRATVSPELGTARLGGTDLELIGRFDRGVGERARWFVEGGAERSDSQDPVFSYDRNWVLTGIHYER